MPDALTSRATPTSVALETTLLCHGVPRDAAADLAARLASTVRDAGAEPAIVGVLDGRPIVGMSDDELADLLSRDDVPKVNAATLGLAIHNRTCGATTVSATMELAARAGVRLFATGGLGGLHPSLAEHLDVSADLAALARHPVGVVTSGVKSILDVVGSRELIETLGVPVVGFRTDAFPAFYLRESAAGVDARFDDEADLASFVHAELARTGRAVVVANPIPEADALGRTELQVWIDEAQGDADRLGVTGRALTPFLLDRLHAISAGATLRANVALVLSNARLAARLAARTPA